MVGEDEPDEPVALSTGPATRPSAAEAETRIVPADAVGTATATPPETSESPEPVAEPSAAEAETLVDQADRATTVEAGTRLADRYRLEDRLSANQDTVTWRAVDEKLRRAVGIHLVSGGSDRSRAIIAAARAAALVGDPRFVQVLDAAEWDGIVYVVKEWLPDADNLTSLLATTPLPPHEIYEMARSLSEAMAVAHRAGLSHLRLDPENVLRMRTGQYKIVGLAVEAALYGHTTDDAAREDTEAIGALMYAALTRRWPGKAAYGLPQAPSPGGRLAAPGQVRAGVHEDLEAVAMRALGHRFGRESALGTPQDVADAMDAIPPVLPPEPETDAAADDYDDEYGHNPVFATPPPLIGGRATPPPPPPHVGRATAPPPALGGRFGGFAKAFVAVVVLVLVVLMTWQIALYVNDKREEPKARPTSGSTASSSSSPSVPPPNGAKAPIREARFLNSGDGDSREARSTYDGESSTYWRSSSFKDPHLQRYRSGIGIVYDLGQEVDLRSVDIDLLYGGDRAISGYSDSTVIEIRGAKTQSPPTSERDFTPATPATTIKTSSTKANVTFAPLHTRYVLVWFTELPYSPRDDATYGDPGLKNGIREITFKT